MKAKNRLPKLSVAKFQEMVLELAKLCRWRTAHFRPGMTKAGNWVTAVQGDGKGFPDLVLVRGSRIIFAELKRDGEAPTPEQEAWLKALRTADVETYILEPRDWSEIERILA